MSALNYDTFEYEDKNSKNFENGLTSNQSNDDRRYLLKESPKDFRILKIILLSLVAVSLGIGYSILAPFFPTKAKAYGVSEFWIGMIVAQIQVTKLLVSPFIGKYSSRLDPKTGLAVGVLITGIGNFLMGYIEWSPSGTTYIVLAMIFRTIQGFGTAWAWVYEWTLVFTLFPENISKYIALIAMFYGFGSMVGPGLGGIIYQFGDNYFKNGFILTFCSIGTFLVLIGIMVVLIFPRSNINTKVDENVCISSILKITGYSFCVSILFNSSFNVGFNEATLDLHLATIEQLSSTSKGGIFLMFGLSFLIFSQIFGFICDKLQHNYWICMSGAVITGLSFVILGPLPFIPIDSNISLVITGQIILGAGLGIQVVGGFTQSYREIVKKSSLPINNTTLGLIGALNESGYAFGFALGPAIGGLLLDQTNYRWATVYIISFQIIMVFLIIVFKLFFNKS